jgi:hypothetical protein
MESEYISPDSIRPGEFLDLKKAAHYIISGDLQPGSILRCNGPLTIDGDIGDHSHITAFGPLDVGIIGADSSAIATNINAHNIGDRCKITSIAYNIEAIHVGDDCKLITAGVTSIIGRKGKNIEYASYST